MNKITSYGIWSVRSSIDERWNSSGESLSCPELKPMRDWLIKCMKKYGKPPKDLELNFHKYQV